MLDGTCEEDFSPCSKFGFLRASTERPGTGLEITEVRPGFLNREWEEKRRLVKGAPPGKGMLACIDFVTDITSLTVAAIAEIFFSTVSGQAGPAMFAQATTGDGK